MNKQQLIDLLVVRGVATREQLQSKYAPELEKMLDDSNLAQTRHEALNSPEVLARQQEIADIQADRLRMAQEQALTNIFRTPVNGKVAVDNVANRDIIRSWLQEDQGEHISPAWF